MPARELGESVERVDAVAREQQQGVEPEVGDLARPARASRAARAAPRPPPRRPCARRARAGRAGSARCRSPAGRRRGAPRSCAASAAEDAAAPSPKHVVAPVWHAGPRGEHAQQHRVAVAVQRAPTRRRARCRTSRPSPTARRGSGSRTSPAASPACARSASASCQATISTVAGGDVLADAGHEPVGVVAHGLAQAAEAQRIGSPRFRHASFTSSTVCVPSWKIEAASAACSPASSASARCSGPAAPPDAMTGTATRSQDLAEQVERVARAGAVGVHRRHQQLAGAALDGLAPPTRRRRVGRGRRPPDVGAPDAPSRLGVDRARRCTGAVALGALVDQARVAQRGGVDARPCRRRRRAARAPGARP